MASSEAAPGPERLAVADLHHRVLEEYAPPSALINDEHNIVHLSTRAGRYLQHSGGEPSINLLKVVHSDLRVDLRAALAAASSQRRAVQTKKIRLHIEGSSVNVTLHVRPVLRAGEPAQEWLLVLFDEESIRVGDDELQALNKELTTVNEEMKNKVAEQAVAYTDIQNLIHTMGIAAIVLDRSLRIKLFTPAAQELFGLISTDCGRPLADISGRIACEDLRHDAELVMQHLGRVEREVQGRAGRRFLQLVPYRTLDGRIDGVVLTFVDITEPLRFEEELRKSEEHMRLVLESITEYAILTLDASGTIVEWNAGAERMFGFSSDEAVGQPAALIFTPEDRARGAHLEEMRIATEQNRASDERWHVRKDGSRLYVSGVLSPIGPDPVTGFVKVARDLTDRKQQEEALRRAHDLLESRVEARTRELASQLSERQQAEDQVRKLLSRLITVQEDERRRIARDLHDDLGQKMTALHLKLEALCRVTTGGGAAHDQAKEAQAFVRQLDRDLDFFTWELRPAALYDLGLTQALRDFVEQWTVNYGIASDFEAIGVGHERWRQDIEVNLYRIAQEALNNVYKHARASRVDVVLQRREDELVLSVEDNGVGFDAPASVASRGRGMGLIGMRERSALLGGTLEIERAGSGGTTVIVRAPAAMDDSAVGDSEEPL